MKFHRLTMSFVLCCAFLAMARDYGGIVVNTTGKPLEGVLVSVGHSEYYTRTDQNGRFFLSDPTPEPDPTIASKVKLQNARWNFQGRSLDLRAVPGVSSVSIYTTNGKRVFSGQIPSSRIVALPPMALGIYVLEFHGEYGAMDRGSIKLSKDASDSERLIFRHYDYLPKDINMASSNTDMHVELSLDERSYVFDQSKIREYRFTMSATDLAYMNTYGYKEEFMPATMKFEGDDYGQVGFRYKGSSTYTLPRCFFPNSDTTKTPSKQSSCPKISYKVKFTQYDKDKRFFLMKKINLHSLAADGTKMHDMLSYGLFMDMGIPAPRTAYANVYVNNTLIGLFLAVEEIDGRFTKSRWPSYRNGNLYKEKWPKSDDAEYYFAGLKTNEKPEDNPNIDRMMSYYNAIQASNEQNFEENLSPYMDFDYFLRYLAVDVAIKNFDGIRAWYIDHLGPGINSHNYFFYEEENAGGKIWLIPWDMDQTMIQSDYYFDARQPLPNWNVPVANCETPRTIPGIAYRFMPPNCDKLTKLMSNYWTRYVQLGDLFLRDLFISQRLNDKITRYSNLITNAVQQDPNINQSNWTSSVNSLKNYIPNNISSFQKYLHP